MLENINPHFSYSFEAFEETDEYRKDKVSFPEIMSVWKTYHVIYSLPQYHGLYYYTIGYSTRKRFLQIVFVFANDIIYFLQARVADEDDISNDYCTKC